ncbi:hypothetical protein B0T25DRAFT_574969, partial [Lasiosphaeria hispida]
MSSGDQGIYSVDEDVMFSPPLGGTVVATPPDVALDNVQALFEDDGEDDGEEDDDEQSSKPTKKGTEEVQQNEGPQESPKKRKDVLVILTRATHLTAEQNVLADDFIVPLAKANGATVPGTAEQMKVTRDNLWEAMLITGTRTRWFKHPSALGERAAKESAIIVGVLNADHPPSKEKVKKAAKANTPAKVHPTIPAQRLRGTKVLMKPNLNWDEFGLTLVVYWARRRLRDFHQAALANNDNQQRPIFNNSGLPDEKISELVKLHTCSKAIEEYGRINLYAKSIAHETTPILVYRGS